MNLTDFVFKRLTGEMTAKRKKKVIWECLWVSVGVSCMVVLCPAQVEPLWPHFVLHFSCS